MLIPSLPLQGPAKALLAKNSGQQADFKLQELAKYLTERSRKGRKVLRVTKNRFGYIKQKIGKLFPWLLRCYI